MYQPETDIFIGITIFCVRVEVSVPNNTNLLENFIFGHAGEELKKEEQLLFKENDLCILHKVACYLFVKKI